MSGKPAAAGAGAKGKEDGRKQLTLREIDFLEDRIASEINAQLNYGREWGELVPHAPKNVDDAIAQKRKELEELRAKAKELAGTEVLLTASLSHTAQRDVEVRPSPETGLGPADLKATIKKSITGSGSTATAHGHASTAARK